MTLRILILADFRRISPPESFSQVSSLNILAGHGGMFIFSKLGQNLSEMKVRTKAYTESNLGPFAGFYW